MLLNWALREFFPPSVPREDILLYYPLQYYWNMPPVERVGRFTILFLTLDIHFYQRELLKRLIISADCSEIRKSFTYIIDKNDNVFMALKIENSYLLIYNKKESKKIIKSPPSHRAICLKYLVK